MRKGRKHEQDPAYPGYDKWLMQQINNKRVVADPGYAPAQRFIGDQF